MPTAPLGPSGSVLAIVGRPNVGKSTLFNRLVGSRKAVVSSTRGTTRDRLYGRTEWRGLPLTLIDAGGFEPAAQGGLAQAVQRHVHRAVQEADGFLFVCDAHDGLVPADQAILEVLRRTGKPFHLVINKADRSLDIPPDFFSLGVAQPLAVSALHGLGIGELLDAVVARCSASRKHQDSDDAVEPPASGAIAMAILGRQNVGKSSILNAVVREERAVVSEVPGTTRDAIDVWLTVKEQPVCLIDTAGLRHRRKVHDPVDVFSMARTAEAIDRCDVALVVLDATQGVTQDDQRILSRVVTQGRGLIVLANKWDLLSRVSPPVFTEALRRRLPMAPFVPVLTVSAKTGFQIPKILPTALQVARAIHTGLTDAACRALLEEAWRQHSPPRVLGRAIRLRQARWLPGRPARVELVTSPLGRLRLSYRHYLVKRLAAHPDLSGVPIRLVVRSPDRAERFRQRLASARRPRRPR